LGEGDLRRRTKLRKLIAQTVVSLDGYFEGPDHSIDWHRVDQEYNDYAAALLRSADAILFGRVTYELMAGYWPTPEAIANDPVIAELMNAHRKIVFSKTLKRADWHNTTIVKANILEEIRKLKQEPGKDLVVLGSGTLVAELTKIGLIDQYQLMVNPVVLGHGTPLFQGLENRVNLELEQCKAFSSGNVLFCYRRT
jgi:dihydrofolate reductase